MLGGVFGAQGPRKAEGPQGPCGTCTFRLPLSRGDPLVKNCMGIFTKGPFSSCSVPNFLLVGFPTKLVSPKSRFPLQLGFSFEPGELSPKLFSAG